MESFKVRQFTVLPCSAPHWWHSRLPSYKHIVPFELQVFQGSNVNLFFCQTQHFSLWSFAQRVCLCLFIYLLTVGRPALFIFVTLTLRSANSSFLRAPSTKLCTAGDQAFWSAAPHLWSSLPNHLRTAQTLDSFKKGFKNILFKKPFSS